MEKPVICLSEKTYRDKVYACWLGKNIGGTLGAPTECTKYVNDLSFYRPLPDRAAPNDDLDLQLAWLRLLQDKGVWLSVADFGWYWKEYLSRYPWNEYGFCQRNLARGLVPPISGCFENYYVDEMGSPIRSEIWACVAPGDPQLAAALAWSDAVTDHAGGEGVHGEMFWAAVESAAFVIEDPMELIRIGLAMIPVHSLISRAVREALWCHHNGVAWAVARDRVVQQFGHFQPCHAPQNHAFTLLGWLYGEEFGDKLCKAVNCGYDTDCTGATLGSVLGIIGGTRGIPAKWLKPLGDRIVLHPFTNIPESPKTVRQLAAQVVAVGTQMLRERSSTVTLGAHTVLPGNVLSLLNDNFQARMALAQDPQAGVAADDEVEIWLHYHGEPVIHPRVAKTLSVSLRRRDGTPLEGDIALAAPRSWRVDPLEGGEFRLQATAVARTNKIAVRATAGGRTRSAEFVLLGPAEAQGFPAGRNVDTCPRCHARKEACFCPSR